MYPYTIHTAMTPPRNPSAKIPAPAAPPPMLHHERARFRAAAVAAPRVYPGPVGEMLAREILSWEEFGYRLGGHQLVMRVVDDVLKRPAATP